MRALVLSLLVTVFVAGCQTTNYKNKFGQGMLTSNKALIKEAITQGADINGEVGQQSTPLIHAVSTAKNDIVAFLLENGASPNKGDIEGIPPLHIAAYGGNKEAVSLLIKHGANINIFSSANDSVAIQNAIHQGHEDIVQMLIDAGADLDITSQVSGNNALYYAVGHNKYDITKRLIDAGANVNQPIANPHGDILNLLTVAVIEKNTAMVKLLIKSGADLDAMVTLEGKEQWTVLFHALLQDRQLANLIIAAGADVNVPTSQGFTPLHYAIERKDYYLVKDLLDAGANCAQLSIDGDTPLANAEKLGYLEIAKLFNQCDKVS